MRRLVLVLASAICVVTGSVAFAADLPRKAPRSTYFAPSPIATWSGFYGGLNFGYGWARTDVTVLGVSGTTRPQGVLGGAQVGYNFQTGAFVFGVEGDFQFTDQRSNDAFGITGLTVRNPWFGTARLRAGYAFDNWLPYVTGGAGYGKYVAEATALGVTVSTNDYRWSWVIGLGVEAMFGRRWSAKLEYLYLDTGNYNASLFGVPYTARTRDNILRIGFNYHM